MSTTNNSENYGVASESAAASEFTTGEPSARVKKKGGMGKVIGFILLIAIALGVAFLGYTAFINKKPTSTPLPPQTAQSNQAPAAPNPAMVDPNAPVAGATALDGLGLENGAIPAADPAANPTLVVDPSAAIDPLTGLPAAVPAGAAPTLAVDPTQVVQPTRAPGTPNQPATPPTNPGIPASADPLEALDSPTPAATGSVRSTPQPVVSRTNGSLADDVGAAVTQAIKPLADKVDRIEGLVLSHTDQIRQLQVGGARRTAVDTTTATATRPATIRSSKPKPRAPAPPVVKKATPRNTIEVISPVEARPQAARPQVVVSQPAVEPAVQMQKARCQVHSILEGRAWVKQSDGSFMSYAVGDQLPDGKSVTSITPDGGIRANGQAWDCPR